VCPHSGVICTVKYKKTFKKPKKTFKTLKT